jgi:hypothetical protein
MERLTALLALYNGFFIDPSNNCRDQADSSRPALTDHPLRSALTNLSQILLLGVFGRRFQRACCCACKFLGENFCVFAKRLHLRFHEFALNSSHFLEIFGSAKFEYELVRCDDIWLGIAFQFFA